MGVFNTQLKAFESRITGEQRTYRVNNAVWLILKAKHGLTQSQWAKEYAAEEALTLAKFVQAVLEANGLVTTVEEVAENTDINDLSEFLEAYHQTLVGIVGETGDKKDENSGK